ncbi:hypothetical protein COLO4_03032 [Corchorus olitorius]|uniref:Uncharacterized protein n=1 Tax=Corchorus olitorius TaxID=93759 RepID=A0A1R3KZM2_9ROSI|nr:hypothetical protein COLO4_03032 [Corchorus olitorius]
MDKIRSVPEQSVLIANSRPITPSPFGSPINPIRCYAAHL